MEVLKLLLAPRATATLVVMAESGLLLGVLGGVPHLASFENMLKLETAMGLAHDALRRLGALGVFVIEDAERLWGQLRLTNVEHERLRSLAQQWRGLSPAIGATAARALLYRLGPERFVDRVLIAWSRSPAGANDPDWHALANLPSRWTAPVFPIKSAEFVRRGVPKGPQLGQALRAAEEAWIAADFPDDPVALDAIAAQAARGSSPE
jgi:poly(A) polymerase